MGKEKEQIEIISHPGSDRSVTIEDRNTGFKKILNALEKNGSPKPEFETDEGEVSVDEDIKSTEKTTEKDIEQRESSVKIIEMMKNNSFVTAEQISSELNISVRAVEKQIRNLREKA